MSCGRSEISPTPGIDGEPGDDFVHLCPGSCPPSPAWRPARFDLQLIGIHQVVRGDAEPAGGTADRTAAQISVGVGPEALFILSAFRCSIARLSGSWNRESLVRFLLMEPNTWLGGEALDDCAGWFHLFERNGSLLVFIPIRHAGCTGCRSACQSGGVL